MHPMKLHVRYLRSHLGRCSCCRERCSNRALKRGGMGGGHFKSGCSVCQPLHFSVYSLLNPKWFKMTRSAPETAHMQIARLVSLCSKDLFTIENNCTKILCTNAVTRLRLCIAHTPPTSHVAPEDPSHLWVHPKSPHEHCPPAPCQR